MISQWISLRVDDEADHGPDRDRRDDDEEALPQLVEMLDKRRLLAMIEATRKPDPRHPQPSRERRLGDGLGLLLRAAAGAGAGAAGLDGRRQQEPAAGAAGCGGGSSERVSIFVASCTPVTESLNSLMPTPSERPISGSRFAPKSSRARISRKIR